VNALAAPRFHHCLGDIIGVPDAEVDDPAFLERALLATAAELGLRPAAPVLVRRFAPRGATAVLLLMESHLSLHTYPELGVVKADAFTCRPQADDAPLRALARHLRGEPANLRVVVR
jgi:S-adenosylmethionine/arginine decarboxylase-like enzyme